VEDRSPGRVGCARGSTRPSGSREPLSARGNASVLWKSIQTILRLPNETRLFTGHDYQHGGREARWEGTVAEQKRSNPHLAHKSEVEFVALRNARDKALPMPKLMLHALQVNIAGGRLPEPEAKGARYLKIPLNALAGAAGA
jgi:hypothetical protein